MGKNGFLRESDMKIRHVAKGLLRALIPMALLRLLLILLFAPTYTKHDESNDLQSNVV